MIVKQRKFAPTVLLRSHQRLRKCGRKAKKRAAITLVEVMVASLIMTMVVIGAAGYRYYATLDAQKAGTQRTAARLALLLCESWRGLNGIETYDPITHFGTDLAITTSAARAAPEDFTLLGSYTVALSGVKYYGTLSWKDVSTELRALNIVVAWSHGGQATSSVEDSDKSFKLTTYTQN